MRQRYERRIDQRRLAELELRLAAANREVIRLRDARHVLLERLRAADAETAELRERWEEPEMAALQGQ